MTSPLSRFTPWLTPRFTLEAIFTARQLLLEAIKARIEAALTGPSRHHTLLVGPRGAGKTHLVVLAYYFCQDLIAAGRRLQVARLPENPYKIVSYRRLLEAILRAVDQDPAPGATAEDLEAQVTSAYQTSGPIVVLVENFDWILGHLRDIDQQRLRHLLQSTGALLFVATTTRLDRNLADQAKPFYAFFTTTRLEPFSVEQAQSMLVALAANQGDQALADALSTDTTARRLRVVEHLAGGQPRLWATFAEALRIDRLDQLTEVLLTGFDNLTPYYEERLGQLSVQQRLIVAELAEADHPLHVAALAERAEIDQRSAAKAVSDLVARGWLVQPALPFADLLPDRRRSYYELAEPLARLSFQIKDSAGEPLPLIIEFLTRWFDPADPVVAEEEDDGSGPDRLGADATSHGVHRRAGLPETPAPMLDLLGRIDDALADLGQGRAEALLHLPTGVRRAIESRLGDVTGLRLHLHEAARQEVAARMDDERVGENWIDRAEDLVHDVADVPAARANLADWLSHLWHFDAAIGQITSLDPDSPVTHRCQRRLSAALRLTTGHAEPRPLSPRSVTS